MITHYRQNNLASVFCREVGTNTLPSRQSVPGPAATFDPHIRTREERMNFEVRRLYNLVVLVEAAGPEKHVVATASLSRALRRFLADFFGLEGRVDG